MSFLLLACPNTAAADWAPRPAMFSYDATFATCTADPTAPDLATTCADALTAAYVLKRAVAQATLACQPESLATCAAPFEDEGLPAIAAHIAVSAGCDEGDLAALPTDAPFPANHCVTMAADIMLDEGIVPLEATLFNDARVPEGADLAQIHAGLWSTAIAALADTALTDQRKEAATLDCTARYSDRWGLADCRAARFAEIWADLARQKEQDN